MQSVSNFGNRHGVYPAIKETNISSGVQNDGQAYAPIDPQALNIPRDQEPVLQREILQRKAASVPVISDAARGEYAEEEFENPVIAKPHVEFDAQLSRQFVGQLLRKLMKEQAEFNQFVRNMERERELVKAGMHVKWPPQ